MARFVDIVYIEFLDATLDYFRTLRRVEALFDFGMPTMVIIVLCQLGSFHEISRTDKAQLLSNVLAIAAILIGFTITCLTVLFAGNSENLKALKETRSRRKLGSRVINLYQLLAITFSHTLFTEIAVLTLAGVLYVLNGRVGIPYASAISLGIMFWMMAHAIALTLRNVANFYFSFSAASVDENQ